jgi:hypothetical protein
MVQNTLGQLHSSKSGHVLEYLKGPEMYWMKLLVLVNAY